MLTRIILLSCLLFGGTATVSAQKKDSTIEFPSKSFVDLSKIANDWDKQYATTIVIIDRKLYTLQSKEWREINKNEVATMDIIKDDKSPSPIKCVIQITMKSKTK